jgi:hypothetical protein
MYSIKIYSTAHKGCIHEPEGKWKFRTINVPYTVHWVVLISTYLYLHLSNLPPSLLVFPLQFIFLYFLIFLYGTGNLMHLICIFWKGAQIFHLTAVREPPSFLLNRPLFGVRRAKRAIDHSYSSANLWSPQTLGYKAWCLGMWWIAQNFIVICTQWTNLTHNREVTFWVMLVHLICIKLQ